MKKKIVNSWCLKKGKSVFATLVTIILIASVFVPLAEASTNEVANAKVLEKTIPKINIKENSRTSQIVQVGDILITLKTDQNHTRGVLNVKNLTTGKTETTNIVVKKNKAKFSTEIASSPSKNMVIDYDPFEPGTTAKTLKSNANVSLEQSKTWIWDNITFVDNYNGLKEYYPHPDYSSYPTQDWNRTILISLPGYVLNHDHIDSSTSGKIIQLSAWVGAYALSAIFKYIGDPVPASEIEPVIKIFTENIILDETGAIWFWDTIGSDKFAYFRIAPFTIQDKLGIGNPRSGTIPPVINSVVLSNYTPNAVDFIRIIATVTDNFGVSRVTANGIDLQNQSACVPNVACVWNGNIIAGGLKHTINVLAYDVEGNIARNSSVSYTGQIQVKSDRLTKNQQLNQHQAIVSQNGNYELIMQGDGNLVLYNNDIKAIWSTNTHNSNAQELIMQNDGNLVLYKYLNQIQPLWWTNTQAKWWNPFSGAYVVMQNDGNLVVYSSINIPLWASNTVGK
jgi:hypothetical protein